MNKELWKSLTKTQKFFYIGSVAFSYGGTMGIALWSFLIEKLVKNEVSIMAKIGCSGIIIIALMIVLAIVFYNRHTTKKLDENEIQQKNIIKEMLMETDEEKKKQLREKLVKYENYEIKIKTRKTIFKNAVLCGVFVLFTLLFYLAEKACISMRGIFFGMSSTLLIGFGFNTAYEELSKKLNLKKIWVVKYIKKNWKNS